jgi:Cu/Ag efflux protein CusF
LAVLTIGTIAVTASAPAAQQREIPGEAVTITATVEAIDAVNRTLTVKGSKGNIFPITVPKSVQRFSEIKVGDTISARYYDNVIIRLKPAGEAPVDKMSEAATKGTGATPAATAAVQRTITATIVAIDNSVPSVTFKGEKVDWQYSSRVSDKAALAKVKVGDRVDITWTEALTVAVVPKKN